MNEILRTVVAASICVFLSGCTGGGDDLKIAPAGGMVKYNGGPLAGANVTFMPDKGPLAMAVTDLKGEFKLATGGMKGCALGPATVAVSIPGADDSGSTPPGMGSSSPKTAAEFAEMSQKMAEATIASQKEASTKKKSLIPSKYKDTKTSGLSYTISSDASKNQFTIELKD